MKPYEKYKDSGIEWVGKIPSHWRITKYKFVVQIFNGFPFKSELFDNEQGFPLLRIRDITSGNIETYYNGEYSDEYIINNGDLVVGMDGDFNIRWWNNGKALLNQRCCSIKPKQDISNLRFLFYLLPNDLKVINNLTYYTTVKHLSNSDINNSFIGLPTLSEQTQIAKYLNYQTAIIDELIAQKEQLITLLKQKRQAVINEAVTKGLNPNAKMKDSGIEWLGEVPESWKVLKLKHIVEMKSGNFISAEKIEDDGLYPVFGGNGIRGYHSEYTHEGYFPLIGRQGALCGNINYSSGKFWATEHAVVVTPKIPINIYWIGELLRIMNLNQYSQASAQPGLSVEKIINLNIPLPSFNEQEAIASNLEINGEIFNESLVSLQESILKLKEYRQSLISEAVTGKIDLRDWQLNE